MLSIVGESGSGKSTLAKAAIRFLEPRAGRVEVAGIDMLSLTPAKLRERRRMIQMIFQDPFGSLNPRRRVGDIITRAAVLAGCGRARRRRGRRNFSNSSAPAQRLSPPAVELLRRPAPTHRHRPGARHAARRADRRRERLGARRLGAGPGARPPARLLQAKLKLAILFITPRFARRRPDQRRDHRDAQRRDRRKRPRAQILVHPKHAYTQALIAAAPGSEGRSDGEGEESVAAS